MATLITKPNVPTMVASWPVTHIVTHPIDLDDQPCSRAIEVDDAAADRMLEAEFVPFRALAQNLPQ